MKQITFFLLIIICAAGIWLFLDNKSKPKRIYKIAPSKTKPQAQQQETTSSTKVSPVPRDDIPPLFIAYRKINDFKRGEDAKRWLKQKGYTVKQVGNGNVYFLYKDNQLVTGHKVTYYQNELWIAALKPEYDPDEIDRKHWENMIQGWKNEGYTQKNANWLKTRPDLHIRSETIRKGAVIMVNDVRVTKNNNGNLLVFIKE
ncbi:MAG: hypothetical protein OXL96_14760 [Candidatus Poribacteria bacterium]|nr:hypothetical protein [Candidatus Poribacteria bacterium]